MTEQKINGGVVVGFIAETPSTEEIAKAEEAPKKASSTKKPTTKKKQ